MNRFDVVFVEIGFGGPTIEVGGVVSDVPVAVAICADGAVDEGEGGAGSDLTNELGVFNWGARGGCWLGGDRQGHGLG